MTETDSMVERVAKAMISAIDEKEAFVRENDGICDVTVDGHVDFEALSRAAIEAMKEPTDDMLGATGMHNKQRMAESWSAMITAALE